MKIHRQHLYIFIMTTCIYLNSCSKSVREITILKNYLGSIDITNVENFDYYIILPVDNCSACIDMYRQFILLNKDVENIKIIICSADTKKAKILAHSSDNIVIDKKYNLSIKYPLIDNSIKFFKIKDKKIENSFILKPSELPLHEIFTSIY